VAYLWPESNGVAQLNKRKWHQLALWRISYLSARKSESSMAMKKMA
jgi:hypothetical protein